VRAALVEVSADEELMRTTISAALEAQMQASMVLQPATPMPTPPEPDEASAGGGGDTEEKGADAAAPASDAPAEEAADKTTASEAGASQAAERAKLFLESLLACAEAEAHRRAEREAEVKAAAEASAAAAAKAAAAEEAEARARREERAKWLSGWWGSTPKQQQHQQQQQSPRRSGRSWRPPARSPGAAHAAAMAEQSSAVAKAAAERPKVSKLNISSWTRGGDGQSGTTPGATPAASSRPSFFGRPSPRSSASKLGVVVAPSSARPPSPGRRSSPPTRPASHRNAPSSGMGTGLVLRSGGGGMRHSVLWPSATYFVGSSRAAPAAATGFKPAGMRGAGYSSQVRI
jgi:hypothetical protein